MRKVKLFVLDILIKRYALGYLVDVWEFCTGYRTQIQVGLAVLVAANGVVGNMDLEAAMTLAAAIGGSASATFLEKLKKHKDMILRIQDAVAKERAGR